VRLIENGDTFQSRSESSKRFWPVRGEKLFSHEGLREDKVGCYGLQYVKDPWDIVGQRNVDGLDLWPKRKSPISNDQRIGVPDTADKGVDGRIQNALLEHWAG
jgi:hypothetical protein